MYEDLHNIFFRALPMFCLMIVVGGSITHTGFVVAENLHLKSKWLQEHPRIGAALEYLIVFGMMGLAYYVSMRLIRTM